MLKGLTICPKPEKNAPKDSTKANKNFKEKLEF
jgi:hypothetical protein